MYRLIRATCVLGVLAVLSLPMAAQGQDIQIGVRTGLNFSSFRGDVEVFSEGLPVSRRSPRLSYHFGLVASVPVTEKLSFRPELVYVQKGVDVTGSPFPGVGGPGTQTSRTYLFPYLQMPLLAHYQLISGTLASPVLIAGPTFSLSAGSGKRLSSGNREKTLSLSDRTSSFDLGLVVGGGVNFTVTSTQTIGVDLRYNPGFLDVLKNDDVSVRTESIVVSASYTFSL